MINRLTGESVRRLNTIFRVGAVGGLADGQLLERFITRSGDVAEAAFAAIVDRHGPMVLRVCRQVAGDPHDADDAFQATFLVLARKARAIRNRDSLAAWLHGVASRLAARARAKAAQRRAYEQRSAARVREACDDHERDAFCPELHEELARLPERYRAPIVLCYFEGRTHAEAAAQLRWPIGTVKVRLMRARDLLRTRLTRRGLAPAAAVFVGLIQARPASAGLVPESLAKMTTEAACRFASGLPMAASPAVILARGWLRVRLLGVVLAAAAFGAVICFARSASDDPVRPSPQAAAIPSDDPARPSPQAPAIPGAERYRSPLPAPSRLTATAGHGPILMYTIDSETGHRILDSRGPRRDWKESYEEKHWVVVTGWLDHRSIREGLAQAFGVAFDEVHPQYQRVELERQERRADGTWSGWKPVDRWANMAVQNNMPEALAESTPDNVRLEALVDLLPVPKTDRRRRLDPAPLPPSRREAKGGNGVEQKQEGQKASGDKKGKAEDADPRTTDAPEIMIRAIDYTIQSGPFYRYRARIVTADPLTPRDSFGSWSLPSAVVAAPDE